MENIFANIDKLITSIGLVCDLVGAWLIYRYDLSPKLKEENSKEDEVITIELKEANSVFIENAPAMTGEIKTLHIDHILSNQDKYSDKDVKKAINIRKKNQYIQNKEKHYNKISEYGFYLLLTGFGLQLIAQIINWIS